MRSVSGAVERNVWQHVVVTRAAATNTIAFYVNGVAQGRGIATGGGDTRERADFDRPGEERWPLHERPARRGGDLPGRAQPGSGRHALLSPRSIGRHRRRALQLTAFDPDGDVLDLQRDRIAFRRRHRSGDRPHLRGARSDGRGICQVTVTVTDGACPTVNRLPGPSRESTSRRC